jgi:hypothetical protein
MIIALLFLILFAILFPKALKLLFALMFIGGLVALGEVVARIQECCANMAAIAFHYPLYALKRLA